jgi:hypothetical protein
MPNERRRVWTICLNCKKRFSVCNAEYLKRMANTKQKGLFCNEHCMNEYRERNRIAKGMKNRIIAINSRAKGEA